MGYFDKIYVKLLCLLSYGVNREELTRKANRLFDDFIGDIDEQPPFVFFLQGMCNSAYRLCNVRCSGFFSTI